MTWRWSLCRTLYRVQGPELSHQYTISKSANSCLGFWNFPKRCFSCSNWFVVFEPRRIIHAARGWKVNLRSTNPWRTVSESHTGVRKRNLRAVTQPWRYCTKTHCGRAIRVGEPPCLSRGWAPKQSAAAEQTTGHRSPVMYHSETRRTMVLTSHTGIYCTIKVDRPRPTFGALTRLRTRSRRIRPAHVMVDVSSAFPDSSDSQAPTVDTTSQPGAEV
ncbi:hypothetical protein EDB89DRAFT_1340399 [Lactarius sanguifluus]|nr:hypothetical protein EDB89DRAFT_1340399 [Lactarius sanguifluus]